MVEELQGAPASNGFGDWGLPEARSSAVPYQALMGTFAALLVLAGRSRGGDEDGHIRLSDIACVGLASHDIARILARDRIAVFVRAPFASGEAAQHPRGEGMRRAVGELLTCPHCLSVWIAAALSAGFVRFPRRARFVAGVFAGHAVAGAYESVLARLLPR